MQKELKASADHSSNDIANVEQHNDTINASNTIIHSNVANTGVLEDLGSFEYADKEMEDDNNGDVVEVLSPSFNIKTVNNPLFPQFIPT